MSEKCDICGEEHIAPQAVYEDASMMCEMVDRRVVRRERAEDSAREGRLRRELEAAHSTMIEAVRAERDDARLMLRARVAYRVAITKEGAYWRVTTADDSFCLDDDGTGNPKLTPAARAALQPGVPAPLSEKLVSLEEVERLLNALPWKPAHTPTVYVLEMIRALASSSGAATGGAIEEALRILNAYVGMHGADKTSVFFQVDYPDKVAAARAELSVLRTKAEQFDRAIEQNAELRDKVELRRWRDVGADRLADEVAVLVDRKIIDSRSPAADALLDYRDPPRSERSDRLVRLESELTALRER